MIQGLNGTFNEKSTMNAVLFNQGTVLLPYGHARQSIARLPGKLSFGT